MKSHSPVGSVISGSPQVAMNRRRGSLEGRMALVGLRNGGVWAAQGDALRHVKRFMIDPREANGKSSTPSSQATPCRPPKRKIKRRRGPTAADDGSRSVSQAKSTPLFTPPQSSIINHQRIVHDVGGYLN